MVGQSSPVTAGEQNKDREFIMIVGNLDKDGARLINLKNYKDLSEVKGLMAQCMWADDEKIQN